MSDIDKKRAERSLRNVLISYYKGIAEKDDVSAAVRYARYCGVTRRQIEKLHDEAEKIARAMAVSELFGKPARGYASISHDRAALRRTRRN
jgi:hypothetical protein